MTTEEKIAALERELAEVKAKLTPPAPPDMSDWRPFDPTARMSMPASTIREMAAAVPDHVVRDIALRDNRAPTGPSSQGAIPSSQQVSNVRGAGGGAANVPGSGTGWAWEIPLGPPPGTRWVDRQLDAQDAKDRHERMVEEARRQAMLKAAEQS